jgi:predicted ATP-dependent endonuclease of OLD family
MQLTIQKFGPIKQGNIDLTKRFFVFVGYNNTGKTYVSQLLWSIFNDETIENFSQHMEIPELNLDEEELEHKLKIEGEWYFDITPEIIDKILGKFALFLKQSVIPKTFNIDSHHFILSELSLQFDCDINIIRNREAISSDFFGIEFFKISKEKGSLTIRFTQETISKEWFDAVPNAPHKPRLTIFSEFMLNLLFNNTNQQPIFLPANRSFYPMFYSYIFRLQREKEREKEKEIMKKLSHLFMTEDLDKIKNGTKIALDSSLLLNSSFSDYTEPMNVLFEKLYRLNENITARNHYEPLVSDMTNILGGDIVMSKKEGIAPIKFGFKPAKHDELLPACFYLHQQ